MSVVHEGKELWMHLMGREYDGLYLFIRDWNGEMLYTKTGKYLLVLVLI